LAVADGSAEANVDEGPSTEETVFEVNDIGLEAAYMRK